MCPIVFLLMFIAFLWLNLSHSIILEILTHFYSKVLSTTDASIFPYLFYFFISSSFKVGY